MNGKILYIDEISFLTENILHNIPYDAEYIIIGMLKDYVKKNIFEIPCLCKKIIILNYESSIKNIEQYIYKRAGQKIPFDCQILTLPNHNGASYTWANSKIIYDVKNETDLFLIEFNKIIPKGTYDLEILTRDGKIRSDLNLFHKKNKILYFKYYPKLPKNQE